MIARTPTSITIELPKSLYSKAAVERALRDFSEIAAVSQTEETGSFVVRFEQDELETALEFSNYTLGMQRIYGVNTHETEK